MANLLKEQADICAVGVTNQTNNVFLANISSGGVEAVNWFYSPTFSRLQEIRDQVVQQTYITNSPAPIIPSTPDPSTTSKLQLD